MAFSQGRPPRIAVVIPAYNHAAYIGEAIASVLAQDWPDVEIHLLDDGSSDETFAVASQALAAAGGIRCRLERQSNAGSARTLNRLIEGCDSDLVAILNSDDCFLPGRLRCLADLAVGPGDFIGFSGVAFDPAARVSAGERFEDWYRGKLAYAMSLPTCGFALVAANLAISSSNFLFSRGLFDRVGGFNPALPLTQDWEFLLKALRWTEPRLAPQRLLYYRTHDTNSFRQLMDVRIEQSRQALEGFVAWADQPAANQVAPTPLAWPRFFPIFARSCAPAFSIEPVSEFLPPSLLAAAPRGPAALNSETEDLAVRNLVLTSRQRPANLELSTEALLVEAAALWQGLRQRALADG